MKHIIHTNECEISFLEWLAYPTTNASIAISIISYLSNAKYKSTLLPYQSQLNRKDITECV